MLTLNRRSFFKGAAATALTVPALSTLTGCNIDWIATAQKDIPIIVSIVDSLAAVALTASGNGILVPVVLAAFKTATDGAQAGLVVLTQIITDEKAQPNASTVQKIETAIADISKNLTSLLAFIPINVTGLSQTISAGIALALSTLSSITLLIPSHVSANSAKKASMQKTLKTSVKLPDSQTLASMYNVVAVANGYAAHQVAVK